MKKNLLYLSAAMLGVVACAKTGQQDIPVDNPIEISFPKPTEAITKVELTPSQLSYVEGNNRMALRLLQELYPDSSFLCSPLSLQFALSMTANGASGETLREITDFLGFGKEGIDALNAFNKTLLEQLPAVDLDVELSLTDALLVNKKYPLQKNYQKTVEDNYYAAVENADLSNPETVAARINEWAKRNTNGFIDQILNPADISPNSAAYLMNALYFKAKWAELSSPMFMEEATRKEDFTLPDGKKTLVSMMNSSHPLSYAQMDGYRVLALPYAGHKFFMYIVLPDNNDLKALAAKLTNTSWKTIVGSLQNDAIVHLKLPKFELENRFKLSDNLKALGIRSAFQGDASFDRMFTASSNGVRFCIDEVYQKARINVAEWGTEAAAVTVVAMNEGSPGPGIEYKKVDFHADHPFFFFIGEASSGTILFEGAYTGKV